MLMGRKINSNYRWYILTLLALTSMFVVAMPFMSMPVLFDEISGDLGLNLVVKPHPGEEFKVNYTRELAYRHGFKFIHPKACDTLELILSAYSVTAGRSTCLTEATLLDKNTGGILPDIEEKEISAFPPLVSGAIPYTQKWNGIKDILGQVTSKDERILKKLSEDRKKFSVDGKASHRLVDLIENKILS